MKNVGKYLYAIPFFLFGIMHLTNAGQFASYMPEWMPIKYVLVYISGLGLLAAPIALIINKKAKLAMTLLGVELLIFVVLIHIVHIAGGDQMAMGQLLKDSALAGGAFYIASGLKD